ncbi:hypothetical protein [Pontibacter sp. G13]|uniref:hypothetical protein n=1 Tax=Pontibacter sp. G13 TaxID=3074898 RepID=UPI00288A451D|nr:hypothetical protein [Pontibacter sp. G13]WNJ21412.1 hypothetical protein RJD25_13165 [Pontibacter sp. G13]
MSRKIIELTKWCLLGWCLFGSQIALAQIDEITLTDGHSFRGIIAEEVNQSHVSLQLEDYTLRQFSFEFIKEIKRGIKQADYWVAVRAFEDTDYQGQLKQYQFGRQITMLDSQGELVKIPYEDIVSIRPIPKPSDSGIGIPAKPSKRPRGKGWYFVETGFELPAPAVEDGDVHLFLNQILAYRPTPEVSFGVGLELQTRGLASETPGPRSGFIDFRVSKMGESLGPWASTNFGYELRSKAFYAKLGLGFKVKLTDSWHLGLGYGVKYFNPRSFFNRPEGPDRNIRHQLVIVID